MSNGVRLSLKSVQFRVTGKGKVELGNKVFGKWVQIARMSGDIKLSHRVYTPSEKSGLPQARNTEEELEIAEVENKVNPRLQKFKEKMIAKGYGDYDIEWNVENNALQICIN
ncbi:unnamed protein product [Cylicocyclus nassatus]|uniref:Uncharacterized protein n=1 Tax=Cylicocyclus nassatus TaxID=53992 RepID=A0AA36DRK1_CYLNA|nr:unnamed protein product [Cylicocyclus nassatus]